VNNPLGLSRSLIVSSWRT